MIGFIQGLLSDDYTYVDTTPIAVIETPSETALKLALQVSKHGFRDWNSFRFCVAYNIFEHFPF